MLTITGKTVHEHWKEYRNPRKPKSENGDFRKMAGVIFLQLRSLRLTDKTVLDLSTYVRRKYNTGKKNYMRVKRLELTELKLLLYHLC